MATGFILPWNYQLTEHLACTSNVIAEGIDVCSVGAVDAADMTMLRTPRRVAEGVVVMGYLYSVCIRDEMRERELSSTINGC